MWLFGGRWNLLLWCISLSLFIVQSDELCLEMRSEYHHSLFRLVNTRNFRTFNDLWRTKEVHWNGMGGSQFPRSAWRFGPLGCPIHQNIPEAKGKVQHGMTSADHQCGSLAGGDMGSSVRNLFS